MLYNENEKVEIFFTGITPTGELTLGHYLGIIKQLLKIREEKKNCEIIIMIADLHALTNLSEKRLDYSYLSKKMIKILIACGLEDCKIFIQSRVDEHLKLSQILSSYCPVSRLKNMIQYKEKNKSDGDGTISLLSYPVMMAADILLYDVDTVIVGRDQKQHVELTNYIAQRIKKIVPLKIPQIIVSSMGGK